MNSSTRMNRQTFLGSMAALAGVTIGACGGEDDGNAEPGGTGGGPSSGGATSSGGGAASGGNGAAASTGGQTGGGTSSGGFTSETGGAENGSGGSVEMGGASGGMGGASETGGTGGESSPGFLCSTETDNGDHSHPLTIPSADIENAFQEAPYILEDGGTGHTHTLVLTGYEFFYLQAGTAVQLESSEDENHRHPCVIVCSSG